MLIHKFEERGLGKAPFRLVGLTEKRGPITMPGGAPGVTIQVGSPGQPMGVCKYCGMGIAYCFEILSADGKRFDVGSECVYKTDDSGLKKVTDEKLREIKRKARHKSETKKIDELKKWLEDANLRELLSTRSHPMEWLDKQGKSLLDYADWTMIYAGNAGKCRLWRMLKKIIEETKTEIASNDAGNLQ